LILEKRISRYGLGLKEIDIHERGCTFEGPDEFSE
jgi:hypothetical protein